MRTFEDIAALLRGRAEELCQALLPGGHKANGEWIAGDLGGGRGRSLSVNLREGVWKDFSSGEGGADLINLIAAVQGVSNGEAKRWAEEAFLGLTPLATGARAARGTHRGQTVQVDAQAGFEPDREDAGGEDDPLWYRRPWAILTHRWFYVNGDGEVVGEVWRFKHPVTGEKAVRPWSPSAQRWEAPRLENGEKRPLLYLPEILAAKVSMPIVVTEGEKAADAVREAGYLATTCMGGAQAVGMTDWSPLAGRPVILWRDKDKGGRQHREKVLDLLREAQVASCREVPIQADKPPKWDAADAGIAERCALLDEALRARPVITGKPRLVLSDWTLDRYDGEPPPVEQLVEGVLPLGSLCLLAGMGDIGKGLLGLSLSLKVAGPPSVMGVHAFGGAVKTFGRVVVIAGEDDARALHQRLHRLSDEGDRPWLRDRVMLVPLPNAGGNYPLIRSSGRGLEITDQAERLRDELAAIEDLRLVIFDPMSRFAAANLEREMDAGQMLFGWLGSIAAEMNATVLLTHHMAKSKGKETRITDPAMAREMIRGVSGLVDGVRAAYALWPEYEASHARTLLGELGRRADGDEWRGQVVYGAVVKANGPHDRTIRTFVRDDTGLLQDHTTALEGVKRVEKEAIRKIQQKMGVEPEAVPERGKSLADILVDHCALAARAGVPFAYSGSHGLWENSEVLPDPLRRLTKKALQDLAKDILKAGVLTRTRGGGKSDLFLDIPSGPFAKDALHKPAQENRKAALAAQAKVEAALPPEEPPQPKRKPFIQGIDDD